MGGRYRKRPIEVDAIRIPDVWEIAGRMALEEWLGEASPNVRWKGAGLVIRTLEGEMGGSPGDMLIRGVAGELYPCKPDIFTATYEPVTPSLAAGEQQEAAQ